MKALTAKDAKCGFGELTTSPRRAGGLPKHGRPVAAIEEFERMKVLDAPAAVRAPRRKAKQ
jgi:hypothetical protein